jgi:adenine phosphoribosyltransferase
MTNSIGVTVKSITTEGEQKLFLSSEDAAEVAGRRVLILDDVISTGESLRALEELVKAAKGNIVCKAAVLAEGVAADREDIVYLEKLPVFPRS